MFEYLLFSVDRRRMMHTGHIGVAIAHYGELIKNMEILIKVAHILTARYLMSFHDFLPKLFLILFTY